ncbi:TPM domain-containing protein [Brevundimonas sp. BAL450]|uniref:Beta-propeller domains of methanol dehydrogenase type n=1 Tax=Brevundimonas abyssalis TAR-001 TaxID=1391729 RepID=A0A8E0TRV3_9CAUL|nr:MULTISPECIES: TPM domain-containing protein [Brevundimonas]MBG7614578.1 TPM domain-containing protein [Brevundimonas sp. BAL450]GAD59709.1 beta-propeller domains of methanol dehydrogenase type [Brevundimonas abyssalis TAR-001]
MRIRPLLWIIVLTAVWLAAGHATAQTFPALTGRVVDEARLLSPDRERQLSERLEALEAETTDQLVVVTVNDLQGYPIEDYGYQLGREWGIGQGETDNGVLLIVAPNERKVRIEVGYGLEPILTDALSARIIHEEILPDFRQAGFESGITRGVDAIINQLTLDEAEALARAAEAERPESVMVWGVLITIGVFLLLGVMGAVSASRAPGRRGRRRGDGLTPILIWAATEAARSRSSGGSGGGFGGGGGFSGGGGSFGGGGASGGW